MRLIFAHHSSIYRTDSSGTSLDTITNTTAASGVDYHYGKNLLVWSDVETRKVWFSFQIMSSKYLKSQLIVQTLFFFRLS